MNRIAANIAAPIIFALVLIPSVANADGYNTGYNNGFYQGLEEGDFDARMEQQEQQWKSQERAQQLQDQLEAQKRKIKSLEQDSDDQKNLILLEGLRQRDTASSGASYTRISPGEICPSCSVTPPGVPRPVDLDPKLHEQEMRRLNELEQQQGQAQQADYSHLPECAFCDDETIRKIAKERTQQPLGAQ